MKPAWILLALLPLAACQEQGVDVGDGEKAWLQRVQSAGCKVLDSDLASVDRGRDTVTDPALAQSYVDKFLAQGLMTRELTEEGMFLYSQTTACKQKRGEV